MISILRWLLSLTYYTFFVTQIGEVPGEFESIAVWQV